MYARELVAMIRTGATYEDIFFGFPKLYVSERHLKSLTLIGASEPYSAGSSADCSTQVKNWGLSLLLGNSANSANLRKALRESAEFQRVVGDLYVKATRLDAPMEALLEAVRQAIITATGSDTGLFEPLNGQPAVIMQLADLLLEQSHDAAALDEARALRDDYINLAREFNQHEADSAKADAELNARINTLDQKLADYQKATNQRLDKLTGAVQTSFNIIASIAARLGYNDLVVAAKEATESIGGTLELIPQIPEGCYMAQHGYLHITNRALPSVYCAGNPTVSRKDANGNYILLQGDQYTKCAVHATRAEYGYTWGNTTLVSNGWNAINQPAGGGHIVTNGLLLPSLAPESERAIQLSKLKQGSLWADHRSPANQHETSLNLDIIGKATKWRITAETIRRSGTVDVVNTTTPQRESFDVTAATFALGNVERGISYRVPANFAISPLGACRWDRQITIEALNAQNQVVGNKCIHKMHQFSPIVLDLTGAAMIDTLNPILSSTFFDLDGNGRLEKTGWVKKGSGLLALDIDGNGKIDNGRELFGEATRLTDGKTAENGYVAMAQYDDNQDGRLDRSDKVYGKLKVWLDANSDGRSQGHELYSLENLGIAAISTNYREVASEDVVQNHGLPESNLVKYESRFWGPAACGLAGCKSYDVFFGSTESFSVSSNK
jgi:hypothetical protein